MAVSTEHSVEQSKEKASAPWRGCGRSLLAGLVAGTGMAAAVLLLCALAVAFLALPHSVMGLMVMATVCTGGCMGGYVAARVRKKQGLLFGAAAGIFLTAIFTAGGMLLTGEIPAVQSLPKMTALMVSAMIGGVIGVNHISEKRL